MYICIYTRAEPFPTYLSIYLSIYLSFSLYIYQPYVPRVGVVALRVDFGSGVPTGRAT
jgi:hypothetical protein